MLLSAWSAIRAWIAVLYTCQWRCRLLSSAWIVSHAHVFSVLYFTVHRRLQNAKDLFPIPRQMACRQLWTWPTLRAISFVTPDLKAFESDAVVPKNDGRWTGRCSGCPSAPSPCSFGTKNGFNSALALAIQSSSMISPSCTCSLSSTSGSSSPALPWNASIWAYIVSCLWLICNFLPVVGHLPTFLT